MAEFSENIEVLIRDTDERDKVKVMDSLIQSAESADYAVVDIDTARPWGGFIRLDYKDGDRFAEEFFPGVDPVQARLGNPQAELSPKILLVSPGQRLSWQVHARRAERWVFLSEGGYYKSTNHDEQGDLVTVEAGEVVQFEAGECHRLVGTTDAFTFVAEIWQHTNPDNLSDEADITRLQDDYKR